MEKVNSYNIYTYKHEKCLVKRKLKLLLTQKTINLFQLKWQIIIFGCNISINVINI